MGMDKFGARHETKSEINVTPLVDVMLVLLIIFMVITPMLQKGKPVLLPQTDQPEKKPETDKELLISVQSDKMIFIDAKWYPEPEFAAKMREYGDRSGANKDVLIKADRQLAYGDVKRVMRLIKDGGFEKIALITERKSEN
jgi:biopolymer transport protein ExbD